MASAFNPGVARMQAAGLTVSVAAYPPGAQGITLSLETIAQKIREGRLDADVAGWAADVLRAAGLTQKASVKEKCQAILDAFRAQTMYLPDPVGAEKVASAAATMCLRPGLCVRARDCDDACVAVGAALMSIGIPVVVVKQTFGAGQQEHVMLEAEDESGDWLSIEPSSMSWAVGTRYPAATEVRVDPMDQVSASTGTTGAEIVTFGAVPTGLAEERVGRWLNGYWIEWRYGRWWAYINGHWIAGTNRGGLGATPDEREAPRLENHAGRWWAVGVGEGVDVELTAEQVAAFGLGAAAPTTAPGTTTPTATATPPSFAQATTDLGNQVMLAITAGDTYYGEGDYASALQSYQAAGMAGATGVGPEIDLSGAPNITQPFTQKAWTLNSQLASLMLPATTSGTTQASQDQVCTVASGLARQMVALYQTAIEQGYATLVAKGPTAALSAGGKSPIGISQVVIGGTLVAIASGLAWAWWERRRVA